MHPLLIEVYENDQVIASFTDKSTADEYFSTHDIYADNIAINNQVLMGWDEYDQYITMALKGMI